MEIEIAEASLEEASLVYRVMRAAFAQYDAALFPSMAAQRETVQDVSDAMRAGGALLVWSDEEPVASARYRICLDKFLIERVAVVPEFQGLGIATEMLNHLENIARAYGYERAELCSRLALPRNLDFYRKRGYDVVDTEIHTGRVTMMKWLKQSEAVLV